MKKAKVEEKWLSRGANEKKYVRIWHPNKKPVGVVLIVHGMAEHCRRYHHFARYLNEQGYIVYASDHWGHGKTAIRNGLLGYLGKNGFSKTVKDQAMLCRLISRRYGDLPLFILGHSFGSFVAQRFIEEYSHYIDGALLVGSAKKEGPEIKGGYFIANLARFCKLGIFPNYILNYLGFWGYNERFNDSQSVFRWLSSDKETVRKYEEDFLCGMVCSTNFYYELMRGLRQIYKKKNLAKVDKNLPIVIMSGGSDPVGNYGKSVLNLYLMYRRQQIRQVDMRIYPGMRHEILNEVDRIKVYEDISNKLEEWRMNICKKS